MTRKAKLFMTANDKSPVVSGAAIGKGGEGGYYTLQDGKSFKLDLADCQALPEGYPRWYFADDPKKDIGTEFFAELVNVVEGRMK